MKKLLWIAGIAAVTLLIPKVASASDSTCFMKTSSGRVIDLGTAICGDTPSSSQSKSTSVGDQAFWADYQRLVATSTSGRVRAILLKKPPGITIGLAKSACNFLKAGGSWDEVRGIQAKSINSSGVTREAAIKDVAIVNILAPRHFCPKFAE